MKGAGATGAVGCGCRAVACDGCGVAVPAQLVLSAGPRCGTDGCDADGACANVGLATERSRRTWRHRSAPAAPVAPCAPDSSPAISSASAPACAGESTSPAPSPARSAAARPRGRPAPPCASTSNDRSRSSREKRAGQIPEARAVGLERQLRIGQTRRDRSTPASSRAPRPPARGTGCAGRSRRPRRGPPAQTRRAASSSATAVTMSKSRSRPTSPSTVATSSTVTFWPGKRRCT